VRYGAHTDYQGFTILRPDKSDWHTITSAEEAGTASVACGGLEVFHRESNSWIQVKIPQHLNALVINAGDLISHWTAGRWHSPLHRVVTSAEVNAASAATNATGPFTSSTDSIDTKRARQSIVFFTAPLQQCLIDCRDILSAQQSAAHSAAGTTAESECEGASLIDRYPPIRSIDFLLQKINKTNITN
jgi:hypothetical protein